jgi:mannosyl-3-phosphoglycerate phosphatase
MEASEHPLPLRLLVFTDLDATLLDDHYMWTPAASAIERLKAGGHSIVLSSSKTLAEMRHLALELELDAPLVAENGATIAIPSDSNLLEPSDTGPTVDGFVISTQGAARSEIISLAHGLREMHGYKFQGFADWDAGEVVKRTGLDQQSATRALERHGTEPIVWDDTDAKWLAFKAALDEKELLAIRGGRFIHLMGKTDKARGLGEVVRRASRLDYWKHRYVVALGDSPNDLKMLSAADMAVVIPNSHHNETLKPNASKVCYADAFGPIGWNSAMHSLMDDLGLD